MFNKRVRGQRGCKDMKEKASQLLDFLGGVRAIFWDLSVTSFPTRLTFRLCMSNQSNTDLDCRKVLLYFFPMGLPVGRLVCSGLCCRKLNGTTS